MVTLRMGINIPRTGALEFGFNANESGYLLNQVFPYTSDQNRASTAEVSR